MQSERTTTPTTSLLSSSTSKTIISQISMPQINNTNTNQSHHNETNENDDDRQRILDNNNNNENNSASYCFILCCSALGGCLFGYDSSNISSAAFLMSRSFHFDLNSWQNGLLVAIGVAGAFLGSAFAGFLGDRYGRKKTLLLADLFFIIGSVVLAAAPDYWTVIGGRVIVGIGIGLSSVITPVFLAEITSPEHRGPAVTLNNVALTGSQFLAALVGIAFVAPSPDDDPNPWQWRAIFGLGAVPALLQIILLFCIPESPRWMILSKKPRDEIADAVKRLGLENSNFIEEQEQELARTPERSVVELVKNDNLRKRLLIGCGLQFFQQLAGVNIAMYFAPTILSNAGFSGEKDPIYFAAPLAFINCAFTFVSYFFVEKSGRRPILITSIIGCFFAIVAFSTVGFISHDHTDPYPKSAAVAFICCLGVFLAFFAPGLGAIPWIINSEIFPIDFRTSGASIATMVNWASNTAVSQTFPILLGKIGLPWTFIIVAGFILAAFVFAFYFVPETKGLSLEQIEELFHSSENEIDEEEEERQQVIA